MKNAYGAQCYKQCDDGIYRFEKVPDPFYGRVSLANGTEYQIVSFYIKKGLHRGRLFLGIDNGYSYTFGPGVLHFQIMDNLNLTESDAGAMADFINGQFELHLISNKGLYMRSSYEQ